MDLKTILAKKVEELSAEEKVFVREHKDELDAEQQSAFASVLEDGAGNDGGEGEEGEGNGDGGEGQGAQVTASDKGKTVTFSVAEAAALKEAANAGAKAFAELEKMKFAAEVDKLVFSGTNKTGRFLPKQKDAVVAFMSSLNEKQRDQFRNIVNNLPKADATMFSEKGDAGGEDQTVSGIYKQIKAFADEKMKADTKLTFSNALTQVYAEKPELKAAYDEALAAQGN
jgi:hypothetical protein